MYTRYGEGRGWRVDVLSSSPSSVGGLKEIIALIEGQNVYSQLKFESGVHRVQRVPRTEQQGRVHTSAITVAVLPEAERGGNRYRRQGSAHRHVLLLRAGRAIGKYHLFRCPDYAPADRDRRELSGREITDQKPIESHARPPARASTKRSSKSSSRRSPRSADRKSGQETEAKRSGPTIFPRIASPIIASASLSTTWER